MMQGAEWYCETVLQKARAVHRHQIVLYNITAIHAMALGLSFTKYTLHNYTFHAKQYRALVQGYNQSLLNFLMFASNQLRPVFNIKPANICIVFTLDWPKIIRKMFYIAHLSLACLNASMQAVNSYPYGASIFLKQSSLHVFPFKLLYYNMVTNSKQISITLQKSSECYLKFTFRFLAIFSVFNNAHLADKLGTKKGTLHMRFPNDN